MLRILKTKNSMHKTYQLLKTIYPDNKTEEFIYDNAGNREKRILTTNDTNDYLHNANNEMHSAGDTSFNYDVNGSMIEKVEGENTWEYVYNVENRLSEVKLNGNLVASYYYDSFGRRLSKDVGGVKTYYFYSDEGMIAEVNSAGEVIKTYGFAPNSTWGTDPIFMSSSDLIGGSSSYSYYLNDHLATPQKMISSNGATVWSADYESFGNATVNVNTVENNLRFPGQYYDVETGEHYNWNRTYMSGIGRYSQVDPIGFEGGDENLFRYVTNSVLNKFDNLGLFDDGKTYGPEMTPYDGHSDFTGSNCFNYVREDYGETTPIQINIRKVKLHHFRHKEDVEYSIKRMMRKESPYYCDKEYFGRLMHQGQDSYSHRDGKGKNPFWHIFLNVIGDSPDDTRIIENLIAWINADLWSKKMIKNYWNIHCCEKCDIGG